MRLIFNLTAIFQDKKIKSIMSESWSVSWPMTLIMFFIFLIGFADVYVAGKFGKEIQAAYGLAFQLYFIFSIAGNALSVGTVSLISRLFSGDKKDDSGTAVNSSILTATAVGGILGIIGVVFSGYIIHSLRIPGANFDFRRIAQK